MLFTAQTPCYRFGLEKGTHSKKERSLKNKVVESEKKKKKMKKAVKDQVKEITSTSKSCNDWSKSCM